MSQLTATTSEEGDAPTTDDSARTTLSKLAAIWFRIHLSPLIQSLLLRRRPSDIPRLVVAVIIRETIQRHSPWSWSNMSKEGAEITEPFNAHFYAATSIVVKTMCVWILASGFSRFPRHEFGRDKLASGMPVDGRALSYSFHMEAAAALRVPIFKIGSLNSG